MVACGHRKLDNAWITPWGVRQGRGQGPQGHRAAVRAGYGVQGTTESRT
jgi:hypothetical protein